MEGFLTHVCDHLVRTLDADLPQAVLVFPDKRAQWFFLEELSNRLTRPLWQPVCCTLPDLAATASGKTPADELLLVARLYHVFIAQNPRSAPDFDSFYSLGRQILRDFDLIDKYRVDPRGLFTHLRDFHSIAQDFSFLTEEQVQSIRQFWSAFEAGETGEAGETDPHSLTRKFLGIWDKLLPLYQGFRQDLADKDYTYPGALWRTLAEDPGVEAAFPAPHYVFIGFSALNACEQALFTRLQQTGKALFYWDYDPYYTEDPHQEAGAFVRQNLRQFPAPQDFVLPPAFGLEKEIRVLPVPSASAQAKLVPPLMQRNGYFTDRRTAVVLADEKLLLPLLYSLGETGGPVNVTMGYPLQQTPILTFLDLLLHLPPAVQSPGGVLLRESKDLLPLLHHPCTRWLLPPDSPWDPLAYATELARQSKLFLPQAELESLPIGPLFRLPQEAPALVAALSRLVQTLREGRHPQTQDNPLIENALATVHQQLNLLYTALEALPVPLGAGLCARVVLRHLHSLSVPFSGLPVEGLQVMGLLETRCLDFEHLVILSAQEDFLPRAVQDSSLIPYNLKKAYGLPGREEQEALWAYHFYRLIQRARKVSLLYATSSNGMKVGEESRYIRQLDWESGHRLQFDQVSFALESPASTPREQEKTPEIMARLGKYYLPQEKSYLSPSALKCYLQCPLRFYYRHIQGLEERPRIRADFDQARFGDVVHHCLERLYQDSRHQVLTAPMLQALQDPQKLEPLVCQEINRLYFGDPAPGTAPWHGSWHLMKEVVKTYVQQVLETDKNLAPLRIYDLETAFTCVLPVSLGDREVNLRLGGRIDRLDLAPESRPEAEALVLIDYKTGKEDSHFEDLKDLLTPGRSNSKFKDNIMQVVTYAFLYHLARQQEGRPLAAVPLPKLYCIRDMHRPRRKDFSLLTYGKGKEKKSLTETDSLSEAFWPLLKNLLGELLNPQEPFYRTHVKARCTYCPYFHLCAPQELSED